MLYEGKAKQVFLTDDPDLIVIHYKDDATAYNNVKKATIEAKGLLNNQISTIIFKYLIENGIPCLLYTSHPETMLPAAISRCTYSQFFFRALVSGMKLCSGRCFIR